MKFKLNVLAALAKGAINIFKLAKPGEYVMAISYDSTMHIVPIISKRAYIPDDLDDDTADRLEAIVQQTMAARAFTDPNLSGVKPIFKTAPDHSKTITQCLPAKGLAKGMHTEANLVAAGYSIMYPSAPVSAVKKKDYSALMASNPDARRIYETTKEEITKAGASFSSLTLEMRAAYETTMASNEGGIMLVGPTGTGKSWACKIMASLSPDSPAPLLEYQITSGTAFEDLVGTFIPNDSTDETKAVEAEIHSALGELSRYMLELPKPEAKATDGGIHEETVRSFLAAYNKKEEEVFAKIRDIIARNGGDNKWKFVPGPMLTAYADGWHLVLNEVNYGNAAMLSCINQFTDGTKRVFVNGRFYERHPNFVIYMTMNPGYEGTDALNVALKNRFSVVNVPPLEKDEFVKRLVGFTKGLGHEMSSAFFSKLFDFSMSIEHLSTDSQYHENVKFSVRNAQRLCTYLLQSPRSKAEFFAEMATEYLNHLTTDNDNSDKVERLKREETTIAQMTAIYTEYEFYDIPTASVEPTLADILTAEDSASRGEDGAALDDADLDSVFETL